MLSLRNPTKTSPRALGATTWAVVAVVCIAQFMAILDTSIVNVALPSIGSGLRFSRTGLQWVINAYTIAFAGFLLLGGRAGDLLGRRSVFLVGTGAFAAFSLLAAVSDSQATLLTARALQGLAAAVMSPATLSIITTATREGSERARAVGAWGAVGGLAASSGALLGGALTQWLGWSAIFAVNVPLGLAAVAIGLRVIPLDGGADRAGERHFDLLGATLVTVGLALLVYGVTRTTALGWGAAGALLPLLVGAGLLAAFLAVERWFARRPLMPLSIFRIAQLRWANIVIALAYAGLFSMFYFMTLFIQQVQGYGPLVAGLSFLPTTVCVFAASNLAPRLVGRFGLRSTLTAGMVLSAAGIAWLSRITPGEPYGLLLPGLVVSGLGMGTALVSGTVAAMQGAPAAVSGAASGLLNTSRMIGGSLGLAVLATVAATASRGSAVERANALTHGYGAAMTFGAVLVALGAVAAAAFLRPRRKPAVGPAAGAAPPSPRPACAAASRLRRPVLEQLAVLDGSPRPHEADLGRRRLCR